MATELVGGIRKIVLKGRQQPSATRFHVPGTAGAWEQVSWGEVLDRAERIALYLDACGIGPDKKVAVYATTRVEWGYCVPAIEACRGVFVPVYFSNTADQTHYVIDHSDAEILFTEMALLPKLLRRWRDYPKLRQVVVWDLERPEALAAAVAACADAATDPPRFDEVRSMTSSLGEALARGTLLRQAQPDRLDQLLAQIEAEDTAAIIYTSGTTGVPKGARLTNRNLQASGDSWHQVLEHAFPPAAERRDILWLPVSHMSGWGILCQGTTYEYETWLSDPYRLLDILPEVRPTMLMSVPAYWEKLYTLAKNAAADAPSQHAELRRLTGGALRFLLSGGAGLKREVKDFFKAAGIHMIEGYGLTECAPNLTMNRLDDYDFDSVGKPMPGVQMKIAEDGEICVKGDNVFPGYFKAPEETAACFDAEGWFHTGDLGRWTERGFLCIVGRKKEIIATSGGKKIGPVGIESRFVGNPYIEHVVLFGNERKYLTALITLDERAIRDFAQLQGLRLDSYLDLLGSPEVRGLVQAQVDAVNRELASYETIKRFHIHSGHLSVDAGHLTPSLKLRRNRVWEDFAPAFESLYHAPGTGGATQAGAR